MFRLAATSNSIIVVPYTLVVFDAQSSDYFCSATLTTAARLDDHVLVVFDDDLLRIINVEH